MFDMYDNIAREMELHDMRGGIIAGYSINELKDMEDKMLMEEDNKIKRYKKKKELKYGRIKK